jgi:hypothetical protein
MDQAVGVTVPARETWFCWTAFGNHVHTIICIQLSIIAISVFRHLHNDVTPYPRVVNDADYYYVSAFFLFQVLFSNRALTPFPSEAQITSTTSLQLAQKREKGESRLQH